MTKPVVKIFRLNNLLGGMNSVAEDNALASFDYNGQGVQAEARDIENFIPLNRGGQTKNFGYDIHKDTGDSSPITGMYRYIKSNGDSFFLFGQGTTAYKLVAGTITSLGYSGFNSGSYLHFETALDTCIICDGVTVPRQFDGTTVTALGGSLTGLRATVFHHNRVFGFGKSSDPSLMYYSDAGTVDTNISTNFINCDKNDGQKITAACKVYIAGNLEAAILVAKERSVGIITGAGTVDSPYTFSKINFDFGVPSFRGIIQWGQKVSYLTPNGVGNFSLGDNQVKLLYQYLSEKVRDKFQALNTSVLDDAMCWHDWKNTRISFAVPEAGFSYPNVIYHLDTDSGGWYKERWDSAELITSVFVDTDGVLYHGDQNGNIWIHGPTYSGYGAEAINAYYKTPYLDFGNPNIKKRILDAKITVRAQGEYGLGISTMLDYGTRNGKSHTINMTAGSYTWGGGVWTDDPDVYQWGAAPISIRRFIPSGYFHNIQFNFTQAGFEQPVDIFDIQFTVEFEEWR